MEFTIHPAPETDFSTLLEPKEPVQLRAPIGQEEEKPQPAPSFRETLGASFGLHNPVVNLAREMMEAENPPVPGYAVYEDEQFKGTVYQEQYADRFINARSPKDTSRIMSQIKAENDARDISRASGWLGGLTDLAAGVLDPTILLPGGAFVRGATAGYRIMRSAASLGAAGAAQVGIQEGVLQATQQTRTAEESIWAVSSAAILSPLFGEAGSSNEIVSDVQLLVAMGEYEAAEAAIWALTEFHREEIEDLASRHSIPNGITLHHAAGECLGADFPARIIAVDHNARPAPGHLAWVTTKVVPGIPMCKVYLGEKDGQSVFWMAEPDAGFSIPPENIEKISAVVGTLSEEGYRPFSRWRLPQ